MSKRSAPPTSDEKVNAFYAQSGGVTAVINCSAAGVIETARKHNSQIGTVYAGRNGIIGALNEDLIDTNLESEENIKLLMNTPSGAFGSCRFKLKGFEQNQAEYERLINVFKAHNIQYVFPLHAMTLVITTIVTN
jgi:6-phosphofructokinase 1